MVESKLQLPSDGYNAPLACKYSILTSLVNDQILILVSSKMTNRQLCSTFYFLSGIIGYNINVKCLWIQRVRKRNLGLWWRCLSNDDHMSIQSVLSGPFASLWNDLRHVWFQWHVPRESVHWRQRRLWMHKRGCHASKRRIFYEICLYISSLRCQGRVIALVHYGAFQSTKIL